MSGRDHLGKLRIAANQRVEERDYWLDKLAGELVGSGFPYDDKKADPAVKSYNTVAFGFSEKLSTGLIKLSAGSDIKLYIILTAGLTILIHKYSGCEIKDIMIGSPILNPECDIEFINTVLVLRNQIEENKTFKELLLQVRQTIIEADKNRNYPIEVLSEQLNIPDEGEYFPLFDAAILLENIHDKKHLGHVKPNMIFSFSRTDSRISGHVEYNYNLYERITIERIMAHFKNLVQEVLTHVDIEISGIDILSKEEKEQLLFVFNDTAAAYPGDKTIHELFAEQAAGTPDNIAVTAQGKPGDGGVKSSKIHPLASSPPWGSAVGERAVSYRELDKQANMIANYLMSRFEIQPNDPICIMMERSEWIIIGFLAIIKTGGAYVPIDPNYPEKRIHYILEDSKSKLVITDNEVKEKISRDFSGSMIDILSIPGENRFQSCKNSDIINKPGDTAYIIYTSGTTGEPKGCMVSHKNVVRLMKNDKHPFDFSEDDVWIMAHSFCFDFSVWEMYGALLNGGKLIIPLRDTVRDTNIFHAFIKQHKITVLNQTPAAFYNLIEVEKRSTGHGLDKHLRFVIFGGDKLEPQYLKEWIDVYSLEDIQLINMYGITETTVHVTFYRITENDIDSPYCASPIGKPLPETSVYILDLNLKLAPIGIAGELYVGGSGVSKGYLGRLALTKERFIKSPFNKSEVIYKTGDLGRWLADGKIEFLGRIDHQIQIRGFRIEPGEIESQLLKYENIREAVVTAKHDNRGDKYLCAYIIGADGVDPTADISALREFLSQTLPDYMVPSNFMQLDKIPITANGKVDRKALPEPGIKPGRGYIAPRSEVEQKLAALWAEVLDIGKDIFGIDTDFFELGGHSLNATLLVSKIHEVFNVNVPLNVIFTNPTVRELAAYLKKAAEDKYISIVPDEKKDYYALSSAQGRLFFLQQLEEQGIGYNIPSIFMLEGDLDKNRLEDTFYRLIERHESFRTSFHMVNQQPIQKIHRAVDIEFQVEYYSAERRTQSAEQKELSTESEEVRCASTIERFIRPFDLSCAPLLRVGLVKEGNSNDKYILMVDMHHIISDGTSMVVLERDFMSLYGGEELPDLKIQYKDFSEWQERRKKSVVMKQQEEYWWKQFAGEIPVLNLPTDYARPLVQSFEGGSIGFEIDRETTRFLRELALQTGVTLYMVLLGLYTIFLSRLSNQEDIVVGTPTAGRRHTDLEAIIGMFVNTLALLNNPSGEKTFRQFLLEVKERSLAAFNNQDYPYEELVEVVSVGRNTARNPLFDTMFVLQNMYISGIEIPRLKFKPYDCKNIIQVSKFDLTLIVFEAEENLSFIFEYSTKLFKKETIERFIRYFKKILSGVMERMDKKISGIEMISEEEKHHLLNLFNDLEVDFPVEKNLHGLFEEQVEQSPDQMAVVFKDNHLSYRALNEMGNCLSHFLGGKGIKGGVIVSIMVERSIEMIYGILGILKAGGAYLPINPKNPGERTKYILKDSSAKLLLTTRDLNIYKEVNYMKLRMWEGDTVFIEEVEEFECLEIEKGLERDFSSFSQPLYLSENLAYIIYTSGSTGNPKGVPITHRNICPLLHWGYHNLGLSKTDRTIQNLSYFFDWSVWEIFITLTSGAGLYISDDEVMLNADACVDFIARNSITVSHITPTQFQYILNVEGNLKTLKYLFIGAEKLSCDLVKRCYEKIADNCRVFNMYGPTETTIISTVLEISQSDDCQYKGLSSVPIGKPVAHAMLLVLDKYLNICPVNVPGELYIAGDGLAGGYLNDQVKTAAAFINNTFQFEGLKADYLYKTGDHVRWLQSGDIEFLGRIDNQVKIRGFRIELGEIVNRLLAHKMVKEAEVMVRQKTSGETKEGKTSATGVDNYLCAYIVTAEEFEVFELNSYLAMGLPDYMIPTYFVKLDKMPLTANGKIDRKALPEPEVTVREGEYTAPRNQVEKKLVKIWSEVLAIEKERIGIDDIFFQLNGNSLKAALVTAKINKEFNIKFPLSKFFKTPTIRGSAAFIAKADEMIFMELRAIEEKEFYQLSYNQRELWFIEQLQPGSSAYNMPARIELMHNVDEGVLMKALYKIVERHDSLRTGFKIVDAEPVQYVVKVEEVKIPFRKIDISLIEEGQKQKRREFIESQEEEIAFDLNKFPLFHVVLLKLNETHYHLIFNMHHIVTDGWSLEILKKEFLFYYNGLRNGNEYEQEPLNLDYKDFVYWSNMWLTDTWLKEQAIRFWRSRLKDGISTLNLPVNMRGDRFDNTGAGYRCGIVRNTKDKLKWLAQNNRTTLFMVMFTIYLILLSRISAQKCVICSIIAAGREHLSLQDIVGFFVNSVLFKTTVDEGESFINFLRRVRNDVAEVLQHQGYPGKLVFKELKMKYPATPVSFNMLNMDEVTEDLDIYGSEPQHIKKVQDVKFDLEVYTAESEDGILIYWTYRKSLFNLADIEYIAKEYIKLIEYFKDNFQKSYVECTKSTRKKRLIIRNK